MNEPVALRQAQFASFARLVPMMYVTLLANAWVMTASFIGHAPIWLTWPPATLLTLVCGRRVAQWWRRRDVVPSAEAAVRELRRTRVLAGLIPGLTCLWALALFPHGNDLMRSHVVFFLGYTIISTMLCLVHVPGASVMVALFAGAPFLTYFALSGVPGLVGISIDVAVVTLAVLIAVQRQASDFAGLVQAREDADRRQRESFRLLRMIDDLPVATVTVDPATLRIDYANQASQALARRLADFVPALRGPLIGTEIVALHRDMPLLLPRLRDPALLPHTARVAIGSEIVDLQVSAVNGTDGSYIGPMLSWAVVTQQVEAERRINALAHYDSLTRLLNRHAFRDRMERHFAGADLRATVLMIDLDGFKAVNDTLGHRVGDELLVEVARRLEAHGGERALAVARLGGDEFAVLLPDDDAAAAEATALGLVEAISTPYTLAHRRVVRIGASIGIALAPEHGTDGETLLGRADMALYVAKGAGKGTARLFEQEMASRASGRARIEARLRAALDDRRGLFVFFQAITDLANGRVTGREASVHWYHPRRGWIDPADFVPVAAETGLIDRLGQFVLDEACAEAVGWPEMERVAVNVVAAQLGKGTLVPAVRGALRRSGLAPDRLELEIAEATLLEGGPPMLAEMQQLRGLGVKLSLDSFGTGYASLARLRALAFGRIKIDGSFLRDAAEQPDGAAVVHAVATFGRRLGVRIVADGIETAAQFDCARREGCHEVQGDLLDRATPRRRDEAAIVAIDELPPITTSSMFAETMV